MLFYRSHWRFAFERDPEREARCLWFAQTPDEGVPSTEADATTPEAPQNPVTSTNAEEGIRGATRASVESALNTGNTSDAAPEHLTVTQIAEAMTTMRKQIQSVRAMRLDKNVIKGMKTLSPEDRKVIEDSTHALDLQFDTILELEENAVKLDAWKGGNMRPQEFQQLIAKLTRDYPQGQDIQNIVRTALSDTSIQGAVSAWNSERGDQRVINQLGNSTINKSQKIEIAHNVWTAGDCDMLLLDMEAYVTKWHEYIAHIEKKMGELHAAVNEKKEEEKEAADGEKFSITKMIHNFGAWRTRGIMGMGFYSINEYVSAFTKVWTAFTEARKEIEDQNANKLASGMGLALENMQLPYGEDINRRLTSTLENDFNKKKNEFKEELGDDNFKTLKNKFSAVKNDAPKAIAVLEVAASHGWLYDLSDLSRGTWPVTIFGTDFRDIAPAHWDENQQENYVGTLTRQNSAGGNDERQKGNDRMKGQQNKEVFMRKYISYLDSHNYWAAMGVGEALLDRGKMAEASEFLAVALVDHIKRSPDSKKYLTKPILEQFGMMKWNEATTFAQNMLVMNDMKEMEKYLRDPSEMEGPLLSTVQELQKEIRAAGGAELGKDEILRLTARILSGETIKIGNSKISIYKNKYRKYWDGRENDVFGTYRPEVFVTKIATDYYTDQTMLQVPKGTVEAMLDTGSTGQFSASNLPFLQNYVGYAIKHLKELENSHMTHEADVFREHISEKIKKGLERAFTNNANEHLSKYIWKMGKTEGGPLIASLIVAGLVSYEEVESYCSRLSGADHFKKILRNQIEEVRSGRNKPKPLAGNQSAPGSATQSLAV